MDNRKLDIGSKVDLAHAYVRALRKYERLQKKADDALASVHLIEVAIDAPKEECAYADKVGFVGEIATKAPERDTEIWS